MHSRASARWLPLPDKAIFVTGTNTEVGKTWLTARLASILRARGLEVAARKPVMSFDPSDETTDARELAATTGEPEEIVCPPHRRYELPLAPPMAADALGKAPFSVTELINELDLPSNGIALIEGVGGPRSPLASDGDSVAFLHIFDPHEVILVAETRLGVINDILTSCDAIGRDVLVFLNHFSASDDLHERTLSWLREESGLRVFTNLESLADEVQRAAPNNLDDDPLPVEAQ